MGEKNQYSKVNEMGTVMQRIDQEDVKDTTGSILITREIENAIANSELTDKQIQKVVEMALMYHMTGNKMIKFMIHYFLNAQKSRYRQSRREYVETNQSLKSHVENKGIVRGIGGFLGERV